MFYALENGAMRPINAGAVKLDGQARYWGAFPYDEVESLAPSLGLNGRARQEILAGKPGIYESHEGFDLIGLTLRNAKMQPLPAGRVCIYLRKDLLAFFCQDVSVLQPIVDELAPEVKNISAEKLLYAFLERLTAHDVEFLENIEQEISDLETALITSKKRNCVREIISLRKRLMVLKRYYEQLLNVLDELQENNNGILDERYLRYFKIYADRVDRLFHNVLNLRDYVTQVRESYQAEVDISLNNIMKIFTVITAIFLPLSLIVGWYGMNLKMPEYNWAYSYPMVIVLSAVVVVLCVAYFRKNRWF